MLSTSLRLVVATTLRCKTYPRVVKRQTRTSRESGRLLEMEYQQDHDSCGLPIKMFLLRKSLSTIHQTLPPFSFKSLARRRYSKSLENLSNHLHKIRVQDYSLLRTAQTHLPSFNLVNTLPCSKIMISSSSQRQDLYHRNNSSPK